MTLALRDYQIEDLAFYLKHPRCINLSDPGTGKTPSVCVYAYYLWKDLGVKTAWAMPKSLLRKNKMELHRFTEFKDDEVIIVDGTPKQRKEQFQSPNGKIFLMGFNRFSEDWKFLLECHPQVDALFVDEIHMGYKGHTSKRTLEMFKAMRKLKYFLAMSGTIIDGRLDSCYPSIHIIEPRYYGNHYNFMMQHAVMDEYGQVITWMNHAKLGRIFLKHGIRRKFDDVYGKQIVVPDTVKCEMTAKQEEAYNALEEGAMVVLDEYIESLQNNVIDAFDPGVATIRCRQVLGHPETIGIHKPEDVPGKDERLLIDLEDHIRQGKPLIIFSSLIAEQQRLKSLCEKVGLRTGMINGSVSTPERNRIDEGFRNGTIDVVVASPATTAVGYNWGHVDHVIFYSLDYSDVNYTQGYKRAIRGVREKPLRISIYTYGTKVEERIMQILRMKSIHKNKVDPSYEVIKFTLDNEDEESKVTKS